MVLKVGEVVRRDYLSIVEEAKVSEAAKMMAERNVGEIVVTRSGEPVGIVTERDVLRKVAASARHPSEVSVREVMSSPLLTISEDSSVDGAIELLLRKKVRRLLVVRNSKMVGVVSMRDIISTFWVCAYCHEMISYPLLQASNKSTSYVECTCGTRYHKRCANQIMHCLECSHTLAELVYPEPEETLPG